MKPGILVLLIMSLFAVACNIDPKPNLSATVQAAVSGTETARSTAMPVFQPSPTLLPPTATKLAAQPTFKVTRCNFEIPEGAHVDCGMVAVPEDRNGDPASKIQLAVVLYHHSSEVPALDPVVYLQGGPGSSAIGWITRFYAGFVAPITARHDLIVIDQRGTGLSEPQLACQELTTLYLEDLSQNWSNEIRSVRYAAALLACRDRLTAQGVNLAAYTSRASAADVRDIVTALGYQQVDLYGASYGGRLALNIMRDYPSLVRAVVLDSPVPLEAKIYNDTAANADNALTTLFDHCAADPDCNAAYPQLQTTFYDLVDRLSTHPITIELTNPFNTQPYHATIGGVGLINGVIWALYSSKYISVVPQAISDISQGDYTSLRYYAALPLATYSDVSLGVQASINCHEQVFSTTPQEIEASFVAHPRTQAYGLSAVYGSPGTLFGICKTWGAAPFNLDENLPLQSDIPTVIFAGEYDPTAPPAYSRQIAQNLKHSYLFEFPGQGHTPGIDVTPGCPFNMALEFLDEPTTKPDDACLKAMPDVHFVTPLKDSRDIKLESFANEEYGVKGLKPIGWKPVKYNHYDRLRTAFDPTQLGIQSERVSIQAWLSWLMDHYAQHGLETTPEFVRERQANGLTWRLYRAEYDGIPVDLAFAETQDRTLAVLLISDSHDHQILYKEVFLPVIDSVVPIK